MYKSVSAQTRKSPCNQILDVTPYDDTESNKMMRLLEKKVADLQSQISSIEKENDFLHLQFLNLCVLGLE